MSVIIVYAIDCVYTGLTLKNNSVEKCTTYLLGHSILLLKEWKHYNIYMVFEHLH